MSIIVDPIKIEKAFTFFMVPFYYNMDVVESGLWVKDLNKISNEGEDGDVLYPYIMTFLQGQMSGDNYQDHLDVYRLNVDKSSPWYKDFGAPFFNYANVAYIPMGKNAIKEDVFHPIKFKISSGDEDGFKSPHLFIYKEANMGVLTFCVNLAEKENYMSDLKLLNYHLHKIHKPTCRCACPQLCINPKRNFSSDEERLKAEQKLKEVRKIIPSYDESEEYSPYSEFTWDMKGLVNLFLNDIDYSLFSNIRMHVFTYCQIDDSKDEKLSMEDLLPDLLRLSRCVSDKYMLPFKQLKEEGATYQGFDNIYYASSVEGMAIIAVAKSENKGFISQMDGNVRLRYIWIYMLAIIQRYTLLNLNRQLMEVESTGDEKNLWKVINTIKNVKIRCYYTDVSPYTQHCQFYNLCCRNLHIREAFNEIEEKTEALNITINHALQKSMEEQERGQRRLNWVVGVLTVFQVAQAVYSFVDKSSLQYSFTALTFLICFALLYIVMKWEHKNISLIKWLRKIYYITKQNE